MLFKNAGHNLCECEGCVTHDNGYTDPLLRNRLFPFTNEAVTQRQERPQQKRVGAFLWGRDAWLARANLSEMNFPTIKFWFTVSDDTCTKNED